MRAALPILLVACTSPPGDVTGDVSGPSQRFVVDRFELPTTQTEQPSSQVARLLGTLAGQGDITTHAADMIAGGRIASFALVRVDAGDQTGAVSLFGADGDDATACLGRLGDGGTLRGNRELELCEAHVILPAIADADPIALDVQSLAIDLAPDATGYEATLSGAVAQAPALADASAALAQMIANDPREHPDLIGLFDTSGDGIVTPQEVAASTLVQNLFAPDTELADGTPALSLGLAIHLAPCAAGACQTAVASCFDRVRDGDEADVDCGGACALACPAGAACTLDVDCDAQACAGGHCVAPTCTDGVSDGREGDVDCGGACTTKCALGERCFADADCTSDSCSACHPDSIGLPHCDGAGTCNN